jgi:predicted RNA-binding Zn ribbon-like protein
METTSQLTSKPRELQIVGGHLALNFANTVDDPEGPERYDHAGTYPELVGWAARIGILRPEETAALLATAVAHPGARSSALQKAHALRGSLIEIFTETAMINSEEAAAAPDAAPAAQWLSLRHFVTDAMAHAELKLDPEPGEGRGHVRYVLTWPVIVHLDALLWPITAAAVQLLTSPQLGRVKKCANCPWVFVDQSKNFSRRWCAMNDCGTSEKMRRYVIRRAAKKQS